MSPGRGWFRHVQTSSEHGSARTRSVPPSMRRTPVSRSDRTATTTGRMAVRHLGPAVLHEPAGERALGARQLDCFHSADRGAHSLAGARRFVVSSTGDHIEPWLSVCPDSEKASGPDGILLRSSAVSYWHGDGPSVAGPRRRSTPAALRRRSVGPADTSYTLPQRAGRDRADGG
jgi:hypothetical protein